MAKDQVWYPLFSVVYFSRGTLPSKRGEKGTTGDLEVLRPILTSPKAILKHFDPLGEGIHFASKAWEAPHANWRRTWFMRSK